MSIHNICFCGEIRKIAVLSVEESVLNRVMIKRHLLKFFNNYGK